MGETISSSRMRDWLSASAPPQEMRIAPNSETPKGRRSRSLYKCALARFDTDALSKTCGLPQQIQPPILFLPQPTVHIFNHDPKTRHHRKANRQPQGHIRQKACPAPSQIESRKSTGQRETTQARHPPQNYRRCPRPRTHGPKSRYGICADHGQDDRAIHPR